MDEASYPAQPPMLEMTGLSKRYGETLALNDVTLRMDQGSIHAVLGENGSGKSTLVKLLSGIVTPTRGTMRINGKPIGISGPAEVHALGLATVFQEVLIAPDRSVSDNILLGTGTMFGRRAPHAERRELVASVLARITRTPMDLDAPAGSLSLAAGQLIVLARALVRRPRILILDEVTAALDHSDREAVFQMMEGHARSGGLILFISHRMDEVLRLADRVSILRNGHLVDTLERSSVSADKLLRLMAPAAAEEFAHGR